MERIKFIQITNRLDDGFTRNTGIKIANSQEGGNCDDLSIESDSDSSCTSHESIARNADFIVFN